MRRIQLNVAKLQLNKEKVTSLTNNQMNVIRGGDGGDDENSDPQEFTYSLSMGDLCKKSNAHGAWHNAYECGKMIALEQAKDR